MTCRILTMITRCSLKYMAFRLNSGWIYSYCMIVSPCGLSLTVCSIRPHFVLQFYTYKIPLIKSLCILSFIIIYIVYFYFIFKVLYIIIIYIFFLISDWIVLLLLKLLLFHILLCIFVDHYSSRYNEYNYYV